jgi:co-chaperonin GroES (HSP10)
MSEVTETAMTALEKKWAEEAANKEPELQDAYDEDGKLKAENLNETVLDRLPRPTGWRLVVLPYQGTKKSKGGIVLADETLERQRVTTVCGYVLAVGDLAYADTNKFPNGPWCQKGDWIVFGRYAGARLNIDGGEIRILNDDEILARINDPEDVLHM